MLVDVATLGAEQMERKIGRSSLRDATIATGVSVDKVLALQGQSPIGVQIANIVMPTEEEREERRRTHHALDEVSRILQKPKPLDPEDKLMVEALIASMGKHKDE